MVGISAVLFSCNKQESVAPDLATSESPKMELSIKDVEIQDGVLKFASKDHVKKVTREIGIMSNMENWYANFEFSSLLKRQNAITQSEYDQIGKTGEFGKLSDILTFRGKGDDIILDKIVDDPRFAAVLNSKGYVIIVDSAYHIGSTQVASIKIDENKSNLLNFLNNINIEDVKFNKIINESLTTARLQDYQRTDGKRRIIAEFKKHNAGVYNSLVVRLRYLKKNWIGWSGTEAASLSFSASGTYWKGMDNDIPFSGSASGTNVEEVTYFVDEAYLFMGWGGASGNASWSPAVNGVSSITFYPE